MLHSLPAGPAGRRLALWLRKPLKSALPEIVDVEVWGLKLRLHSRGNLSEQRLLLMPQHLDGLERRTLARELKAGDVFFDIGANAGVYSLWVAATCGADVRVEAFEPDPEMCRRLSFNLRTNGLTNVHLHPLAVGATAGHVSLITGAGNKGENRIDSDSATGTRVEMTTLANFLAAGGFTRIDALKIDVEGNEVAALEPLFENSPRTLRPRALICELEHDTDRSLAGLLARHGYRLDARGRLNGIYRPAS